MRARDRDRVHACATLDEALDDNQLTAEDHAVRIEKATRAATLGDLHALIDDLQGHTDLHPLRRRLLERFGVVDGGRLAVIGSASAAAVALAVVVGAWGVQTYRDGATATSAYGPEGYLSVTAIDDILTAAPDAVGSASAYSVVFFRDRATFSVQDPSNEGATRTFTYRNGDWSGPSAGEPTDDIAVQYAQFDPTVLAGLVLGAPESTGVHSAEQVSFVLRAGESGGEVAVRTSDGAGARGTLVADSDGSITRVDDAIGR